MEQAMAQVPVRAARARPPLRTRITWTILFVVATIHGLACLAQPILAGVYLNGDYDAILVHGPIGDSLVAVTMMALAPSALLFLVPGRGPCWPLVLAVLLFFAEGLQVGMGYARQFAIHIPLGVAIVGTAVALVWYLVRWRYRVGRQLRGGR